jgi:hypothetical protein
MSGTNASFEAKAPRPLFQTHLAQAPANWLFQYDVTGEGMRFLLDSVVGGSSSALPLNVVVNWSAALTK